MFQPVKIAITGLMLAAMLPVSAMALYDPSQPVTEPAEGEVRITMIGESPDTPVMSPDMDIPQATLDRQAEVDKLLFETYADKLTEYGFKVTHTSPNGDIVEIGITPYSEESAALIVEMVGTAGVKVVEGLSPEIYATTVSDGEGSGSAAGPVDVPGTEPDAMPAVKPDAKPAAEPAIAEDAVEIRTTAVQEDVKTIAADDETAPVVPETKQSNGFFWLYGAAAAAAVGFGAAIFGKGKKTKAAATVK